VNTLRIDFAPRRTKPLWWALLCVGLVLAALLALRIHQLSTALDAARARGSALERQNALRTQPVNEPARALTKAQIAAINKAVVALNTPWPDLLAALERARPDGVALLRLEPRPAQNTLRIVAEAEKAAALFALAEALQRDPHFSNVAPAGQEVADTEQGRRIRLSLDATWK